MQGCRKIPPLLYWKAWLWSHSLPSNGKSLACSRARVMLTITSSDRLFTLVSFRPTCFSSCPPPTPPLFLLVPLFLVLFLRLLLFCSFLFCCFCSSSFLSTSYSSFSSPLFLPRRSFFTFLLLLSLLPPQPSPSSSSSTSPPPSTLFQSSLLNLS